MYYVYVLLIEKDKNFYVGHTKDLRNRIVNRNRGQIRSARAKTPFKLVYYEASLNQEDAIKREKYLKTSGSRRYLKNRLRNFLDTI